MKKILLTLPFAALIALAGCKKDSSNKPTTLPDSYWPLTPGSSWTYKDVAGTSTTSYTVNMTGGTSTINDKKYYITTAVKYGTNIINYVYEGNHIYALRAAFASLGGTSLEFQVCNDGEPAGFTWTTQPSDDGFINGVAAQTVNKVVSTNGNRTVNGKTYGNVIHMQVDLQYDFGGGFESAAIYDFYLAKGVGLIESDTSSEGTSIDSSTLTSYTVK